MLPLRPGPPSNALEDVRERGSNPVAAAPGALRYDRIADPGADHGNRHHEPRLQPHLGRAGRRAGAGMVAMASSGTLSGERLMRDVRMIAQWERLSGSPEERQAFAYIERELRAAKVRTRMLEHPALISLPRRASFRLVDPRANLPRLH